MSESDKKGIIAQIVVGVVVGIIAGMITGSGTAYIMVTEVDRKVVAVDRKVESHIVQNSSTESQIRRDVARLEQGDLRLNQKDVKHDELLHSLDKSLAVLAGYINEKGTHR